MLAALTALIASLFVGLGTTPSASAAPTTYSIWPSTVVPTNPAENDRRPVELGVKFQAATGGWITAIRYYKSVQNTGPHTGRLWDARGRELANVSFANETTSGWQQANLSAAVKLQAGQSYTASYRAPAGRYANDTEGLSPQRPTTTHALSAVAGVYSYGTGMPSQTWKQSNYFVDVVFTTQQPATPGATSTTTAPRPSTTTTAPRPSTTTTAPRPSTTTATPTTTPTSTPTPSSTTPSAGGIVVLGRTFPSAATTGVPAGTSLSAYTGPCSIQTNNAVIDAKTINCDLRILAQNVTIKNSIINGTIYSDPDYFNGSFTLTDSEVRMPLRAGTGIGEVNFVVTRVEVTGGSRSINCAANCTVQDSYLHGQYTDQRGIDHESAVRMGANSVLRHNTITCDATPVPPDAGCSAALTGYGDFAIVQKNTIDNNLIDGGPYGSMGYCAYGGSTTGKPYSNGVNNIKFTNNIFMRGPNGKCGIWGPITSFDSAAPGNVWSNNLWDDGKAVPAAN